MASKMIYLDHNATTPCDPEVVEAMLPWFYENPGNAASRTHIFGWKAEEAVKLAREKVAAGFDAEPEEIVFTSGATESVNLALKGVFEAYQTKGKHIITLNSEHKAVLDTCKKLEKWGAEIDYLPVDASGLVDPEILEKAIRPDTILVAVMWANNETGVVQDMEKIGNICEKYDVLLFSDATQAFGKIPTPLHQTGIHLAACSAHKLYGPKGVGALYTRRKNPRVKIIAQIDGGGHEKNRRSGTLNVPGIVGFGKAVELAMTSQPAFIQKTRVLRNYLESELLSRIPESQVNGSSSHRLPHVANLAFKFVESESLMMSFNQQIAVASGSACTSASLEPSHVLRAMGLSSHIASSSIRFSLGKWTTREEIDQTIQSVVANVENLRGLSPIWALFQDGVDVEALL